MKKLKLARNGYIAISVVFFLAAAVYLLFPDLPSIAMCLFCGITLIAYGIIKIIGFFSEDLYCLAFRYDFTFGLLILVIGVLVVVKNTAIVKYLTIGLGWLTLLDNLFKIQMVKEARDFGLEHWSAILAIAIATGAISVFLIINRFPSPFIGKVFVGITLFLEGCINTCVVQWAVKFPDPPKRQETADIDK